MQSVERDADCGDLVELRILVKLLRFCLVRKYSKLRWLNFNQSKSHICLTTQFRVILTLYRFWVKFSQTQLSDRLHSNEESRNLGQFKPFPTLTSRTLRSVSLVWWVCSSSGRESWIVDGGCTNNNSSKRVWNCWVVQNTCCLWKRESARSWGK